MIKIVKEHIGFHYLLTEVLYFDSFEIEYISLEVLIKMRVKSVTQLINLLWILSYRFHRI